MPKFRNLVPLATALDAFNEGRFEESKRILDQFKTQVGAAVDIGGLQVRQQAQKLQEQRFGQAKREFETTTLPESQVDVEGEKQKQDIIRQERERAEQVRQQQAELIKQYPQYAGVFADMSPEAILDMPKLFEALEGARTGGERLRRGIPEKDVRIEEKVAETKPRAAEASIFATEAGGKRDLAMALKLASETDDETTARDLLKRGGMSESEIDAYMIHAWMKKSVGALGEQDYTSQITGLIKHLSDLQLAPTIEEAAQQAREDAGGDEKKARDLLAGFMKSAQAEGKPLRTKADKAAAINTVNGQINALNNLMSQTPIGRIGENKPLETSTQSPSTGQAGTAIDISKSVLDESQNLSDEEVDAEVKRILEGK
jgi:hypothetical protein